MNQASVSQIVSALETIPFIKGRRLIAIVGAPASGKSTLAEQIVDALPNACVVPMDGFHMSNEELSKKGLLRRKGAPQTFVVQKFVELIQTLKQGGEILYPTFDRDADAVIPYGGKVGAGHDTVIVEGNYLLLDADDWRDLKPLWDFSVFLDVPIATLQNRLVERWCHYGHKQDAAIARAELNDLPNARLVSTSSFPADLTLRVDDHSAFT